MNPSKELEQVDKEIDEITETLKEHLHIRERIVLHQLTGIRLPDRPEPVRSSGTVRKQPPAQRSIKHETRPPASDKPSSKEEELPDGTRIRVKNTPGLKYRNLVGTIVGRTPCHYRLNLDAISADSVLKWKSNVKPLKKCRQKK